MTWAGFHLQDGVRVSKMGSVKVSFIFLVVFGFVCAGNAEAFPSLIRKSGDDNAKTEEKTIESAGAPAKSGGEATATTATPEPGSSCGGLKGFLHICEKNEPTDSPKKVEKRSASDDSEGDSESNDSEDSGDSDERPAGKSSVTTEEGIDKREAKDPEEPDAPEEPPMVDAAPAQPEETPAEAETRKKRQAEDSGSSEETEDDRRRRRSCGDGDGETSEDRRRKRQS